MNALARLVDRLRHPAEYPDQRAYRRWRGFLDSQAPAPPYVLTSARVTTEVSHPGDTMDTETAAR